MFHTNWQLSTCGDGYWSNKAKDVRVVRLELAYLNEEQDFGELRVFFDKKTWNVGKDGLIYTDRQFLDELREHLHVAGFDTSSVDYSEQGMQGDDYVSLDVTETFIASWMKRSPVLA